jgi:outer membrane lipoprotein SlyB
MVGTRPLVGPLAGAAVGPLAGATVGAPVGLIGIAVGATGPPRVVDER